MKSAEFFLVCPIVISRMDQQETRYARCICALWNTNFQAPDALVWEEAAKDQFQWFLPKWVKYSDLSR